MASPEEQALGAGLRELLGNMYAFYLRAHSSHWNVEGPFFGPLHEFFRVMYTEVFAAIDPVAEYLRFHQMYGPTTLSQLQRVNTIPDTQLSSGDPMPMLADLLSANSYVLQTLHKLKPLAEGINDPGLNNFLDGRIDVHNKNAWQLRSHLKKF